MFTTDEVEYRLGCQDSEIALVFGNQTEVITGDGIIICESVIEVKISMLHMTWNMEEENVVLEDGCIALSIATENDINLFQSDIEVVKKEARGCPFFGKYTSHSTR